MVMVSPRLNPQASWEFEAEILVLHHPTTISPRYQAMGESRTHTQARTRTHAPCTVVHIQTLPVSSPLSLPSPLWEHQTDSHHPHHEQGLSEDGGQGGGPLSLHQDPGVPAPRPEAGVQGGPHQGCGHHHQGRVHTGFNMVYMVMLETGFNMNILSFSLLPPTPLPPSLPPPQLLQSVNSQAAKAQQMKLQSSKKALKDGQAANEEAGSTARPGSPNSGLLPVSRKGRGLELWSQIGCLG